ncbi:hypothetical protein ATSB10_38000 [Dyella thiooxydans]|uniref:glutathione-specific gamma-glutamylcyclotransferase n=1 Tax=Dyella thiooxydans TaxID=445710 RepID=A0A160N5Z3_9GAMM|nr:gamma-glutamylcyclotransferase [Dyella thiooxydans]AND71254.1 hypothetical protein ATSB10_38000 [Dyella thiooxydans]
MLDTTLANRHRTDLLDRDSVWLFGYGSILYKTGFDCLERRPASLHGWARRFWQGSHDHRGTPEAPGRVVTLVREAGARCLGVAFRIRPATLAALDVREKNGYLRETVELEMDGGSRARAVSYIAPPGNGAWLGPAPEPVIARQIANAKGPSGPNRDYLLGLAASLRTLGADDTHVFALESAMLALSAR